MGWSIFSHLFSSTTPSAPLASHNFKWLSQSDEIMISAEVNFSFIFSNALRQASSNSNFISFLNSFHNRCVILKKSLIKLLYKYACPWTLLTEMDKAKLSTTSTFVISTSMPFAKFYGPNYAFIYHKRTFLLV